MIEESSLKNCEGASLPDSGRKRVPESGPCHAGRALESAGTTVWDSQIQVRDARAVESTLSGAKMLSNIRRTISVQNRVNKTGEMMMMMMNRHLFSALGYKSP